MWAIVSTPEGGGYTGEDVGVLRWILGVYIAYIGCIPNYLLSPLSLNPKNLKILNC